MPNALRDLAPPILWNWIRRKRYGEEVQYANRRYGPMQTDCSAVPLHVGRYAEIFERVSRNDPNFSPELRRYRTYNICQAARWSLAVPGDFLCVGVSFGVTPRTAFEFLDFAATGRTYHLVDPFNAPAGSAFNNDPDLVRQQYPRDARVVIHRAAAPEGIPGGPFAFAHFDIGGREAEIASAPLVYERLTPGGIVTFDAFGSTSAAMCAQPYIRGNERRAVLAAVRASHAEKGMTVTAHDKLYPATIRGINAVRR